MYFEQEEEYMSEPIDEMSQSSYIKINKKFLQELKSANQIDDLSRYRPQSDLEEDPAISDQIVQNSNSRSHLYQEETYQHSPIKSNFYKALVDHNRVQSHNHQESNLKLSSQKKYQSPCPIMQKSPIQSPIPKHPEVLRQTSKFSKLSKFQQQKKQFITPQDNTFEYFLLRKSHDRKQKQNEFVSELNSYNQINEMVTKPNLYSPQNQATASNRFLSPKTEFERINYKKLLQTQISKNKDLQKHIYKLEQKLARLTLDYEQSAKSTKKLEKQLTNAERIRKQNKTKMKELDGKLEGLKHVCKVKNSEKDSQAIQLKKQNKALKEENQKYRAFVETLSESIFVLKGKKPKRLQDVWQEWKDIFESFSRNKWTLNKTKSPGKRA